jgi:NADH-quinone oxidoreductase subunit N
MGNLGQAVATALLPDAIVVVIAGVVALLGVLRPGHRPSLYRWIACIALAGAVAASGFELFGMRTVKSGVGLDTFGGGLVADHLSVYVTIAACVVAFIVCLLSDSYISRIPSRAAAFFALLLMSVAATSTLAAEHEMITFFVALQTLVVCLGLIAALTKTDSRSTNASFAVLREGALASALLLYGLTVLYGATGSTDFRQVASAAHRAPLLVAAGTTLTLLGLSFAAGVLPFRRWLRLVAADVPATPAAFLLALVTGAGAVAWLRFGVDGLGDGVRLWVVVAAILAAGSALYAGAGALRERSLRRLLAHLVSAQAAVLLLGSISFSGNAGKVLPGGATAVLFAIGLFSVGVLAVFAVVGMLENAGLGTSIDDLRGLAHRSPAAALLLGIALASAVGLPPLGGFIARLVVFESAVGSGLAWLVVVQLAASALLVTAVARFLTAMYAETGDERPFTLGATPRLGRTVAVACCLGVFLLGVISQPLLVLASGGASVL